MKKFLPIFLLVAAVGGGFFVFGVWRSAHRDLPPGEKGPDALFLARKIEQATRSDAWKNVRSIAFASPTTGRSYYWEKKSGSLEVVFPKDGRIVRMRIPAGPELGSIDAGGIQAAADGQALSGDEVAKMTEEILPRIREEIWLLSPFRGLAKESEIRFVGHQALLWEKSDQATFLIVTDRDGLPMHWKVWQKGAFVQGREISFDDWTTGPGPRVSLVREDKTGKFVFQDFRMNSN